MKIDSDKFLKRIQEMAKLYVKVKQRIIYAETVDSKTILTCINELRNAFDHVMRAVNADNYDNTIDDLDRANNHLNRAAYDAYEIIAISALERIKNLMNELKPKYISMIYPKYFEETRPIIIKIQKALSDARSNKPENDTFEKYEDSLKKLMKVEEEINSLIEPINKAQRDDKISKQWGLFWKIIIPLVIFIMSGIIILFVNRTL